MGKIVDTDRLARYHENLKTYIGGEIKIKKIKLNGNEVTPDTNKEVNLLVTPAGIGAETEGAVDVAIENHNEDQTAHPHIQENFLAKDMLFLLIPISHCEN